jgi:hypothetical protein
MKFEIKGNENYAATIVKISNLISLEGCDNIQGTTIFGNHVIIAKSVKEGDVGIFFPIESKISDVFLKANNLYDKPEINKDTTVKGFFNYKGRVRCVKLRKFPSEGFWIPIESLNNCEVDYERNVFKENTTFDHINGIKICEKYFVPVRNSGTGQKRNEKKKKTRFSKIIDSQFRFHTETAQLGRNLHRFNPDTLLHLSFKLHGTSGISSYVLCKKKLSFIKKLFLKFKLDVNTTFYDYVYASRKVIKNSDLCENQGGFYKEDIWSIAHEELKPFLQKGMTLYYEVVGYLPSGGMIQKDYDYGCEKGQHKIFIYRITETNADGKVFEFSGPQVQLWCKHNGLNAVPELYYGKVKNLISNNYGDSLFNNLSTQQEYFQEYFLKTLMEKYLEKDCYICKNKVPEEGCVIRIEDTLDIESYKLKSLKFYERETALLDKEEINIEDNQGEDV